MEEPLGEICILFFEGPEKKTLGKILQLIPYLYN
jgi:hypothetical protein